MQNYAFLPYFCSLWVSTITGGSFRWSGAFAAPETKKIDYDYLPQLIPPGGINILASLTWRARGYNYLCNYHLTKYFRGFKFLR